MHLEMTDFVPKGAAGSRNPLGRVVGYGEIGRPAFGEITFCDQAVFINVSGCACATAFAERDTYAFPFC
jgi:hypothetical protein